MGLEFYVNLAMKNIQPSCSQILVVWFRCKRVSMTEIKDLFLDMTICWILMYLSVSRHIPDSNLPQCRSISSSAIFSSYYNQYDWLFHRGKVMFAERQMILFEPR